MKTCPFWSTNKERVTCNKECPMHPINETGEECIFKECLESNINYKEVVENFAYSEDNYLGYTAKTKIFNY